jgi:hypothetical protein
MRERPEHDDRIDRDGPLAALRRGVRRPADLVAAYRPRLAPPDHEERAGCRGRVQDAFLSVIGRSAVSWHPALRSWLYRIVANAAYQHCRRRRFARRVSRTSCFLSMSTAALAPVADWSMASTTRSARRLRIVPTPPSSARRHRAVVAARRRGPSQQETAGGLAFRRQRQEAFASRAALPEKGVGGASSGQRSRRQIGPATDREDGVARPRCRNGGDRPVREADEADRNEAELAAVLVLLWRKLHDGGVVPAPALGGSRRGRSARGVRVQRDLSVPGHPRSSRPVINLARSGRSSVARRRQVAMRQCRYAGMLIHRHIVATTAPPPHEPS